MGLFDFLWRLLGGAPQEPKSAGPAPSPGNRASGAESHEGVSAPEPSAEVPTAPATTSATTAIAKRHRRSRQQSDRKSGEPRHRIQIDRLHYQSSLLPTAPQQEIVASKPYRFANMGPYAGTYLDLSQDSDQRWLEYYGLPSFQTPDDLAAWLKIPVGRLAWLTNRTAVNKRPATVHKSHYHYRWVEKRSGGWRLIEAPKAELKRVQEQILREILDHVPAHAAAHGFVPGRSIVSNAGPHVGQRMIIKLDLENFYTNVRYSRVVAIFRSLGYSREAAIWLARLTTSALPWNLKSPLKEYELTPYKSHHLPQGAATSPALANLSAFNLDVRLSGLARAYSLKYTRYADDLTFSGSGKVIPALSELIPLIKKIVWSERFYINRKKLRVIRDGQRQSIAGVVVNERINIARDDFDRLKAILHNCVKSGPATQNRDSHPNFADHLRGRIAHVRQLNPKRGAKLLALYQQIRWSNDGSAGG